MNKHWKKARSTVMPTDEINTMERFENKLDKLSESIETLRVDVAGINTKLDTMPSPLPCALHNERMDTLGVTVREHSEDIDDLKRWRYKMVGVFLAVTVIVQLIGFTLMYFKSDSAPRDNTSISEPGSPTNGLVQLGDVHIPTVQ